MLSANEIKMRLIKMRFQDKMPFMQIVRDSGCSQEQVKQAMRLEASETIQRRLNAYLEAKNLHVVPEDSKLEEKIREFNKEMWYVYRAHSMKMEDVKKLSTLEKKRMLIRMEIRLLKLLRIKLLEEGTLFYIPDGLSYWQAKAKYSPDSDWRIGVFKARRDKPRNNSFRQP